MAEQEPVYLIVAENATTCRKILARGGCDRCALRHCAPPWALYDAAPATLRWALRSALDVPQNEGCALCLGALAETTARAVARAATAHAGLGAARGWALRVAAPPSWAVRDAAAGGTTHSVKDALRRVVAADLDRLAPPEQHGSGTTGALLLRPGLRRRAGRRRRAAGAAPAKAAETEGPRPRQAP